jgi:MFS family permease
MMVRKTLAERLDDSVQWTGIPDLVKKPPHRRPRRWAPLLALTLATGGLLYAIADNAGLPFGYMFVMVGYAVAVFMPLSGPVKNWTASEVADERERELRRTAYLVALTAVAGTAFGGIMLLAALTVVLGWSIDQLCFRLMALAFYLATQYSAVPTLYASWALRPEREDEDA